MDTYTLLDVERLLDKDEMSDSIIETILDGAFRSVRLYNDIESLNILITLANSEKIDLKLRKSLKNILKKRKEIKRKDAVCNKNVVVALTLLLLVIILISMLG